MERKLIANHLVPDDEVWVSPSTSENPFSLQAKESTATNLHQLKDVIAELVQRYESADRKIDFAMWFRTQVKRLRQLSAI